MCVCVCVCMVGEETFLCETERDKYSPLDVIMNDKSL